jgi:hypothetical protein
MAGKLEGVGIATLLVSLALVAPPYADAKPGAAKVGAVNRDNTDTCQPNLARADYVGGVDVSGNRIAPADIGVGVDLSHVSATPILVPGRHSRHMEIIVRGVGTAKPAPPCKHPSR